MAFNFAKKFVFIFVILAIFGSFYLGMQYGRDQVICETCKPETINFSLFWEAWKKLQDKYVDKADFDVQKMIYGAISGMVKSLDDPYTVFMDPEESKKFTDDVNGSFEGVGMEIGIKKGQLQVVAPLNGTPAEKAGLRAGDIIMKIDDKVSTDMTTDEAVDLIRGPKGTEVILTVYRDEWGTAREIKIIRGVIKIPSVEFEIKEGSIAYIKISQFSAPAASEFQDAAINVLNSSADRIIIDLRNNPGGYLEIAQKIAGWFLEKGQTVVIEDFGEGKEQEVYKSNGYAKLLPYPVVILINQGSASASEILAGALRDNRGIKLIGEQSFGKGSVQELEELTDDSFLKITVAKWLTPNGESISEKGLEPDIEVEITDEDYEEGKDPQMDKAIEIIKNL